MRDRDVTIAESAFYNPLSAWLEVQPDALLDHAIPSTAEGNLAEVTDTPCNTLQSHVSSFHQGKPGIQSGVFSPPPLRFATLFSMGFRVCVSMELKTLQMRDYLYRLGRD